MMVALFAAHLPDVVIVKQPCLEMHCRLLTLRITDLELLIPCRSKG